MDTKKAEPVGIFPTPYGVSVPVFPVPEFADPKDNPDGVAFDIDGALTMAAIHDPAARTRFKELLHNGDHGSLDFADFGGIKVPRVALPVPSRFVYPTIPDDVGDGTTTDPDVSMRGVVDTWTTAVTDTPHWSDRATILLTGVDTQITHLSAAPGRVIGLGVAGILTAVLENLGEKEIDCLEAASFYLLSSHDDWQEAGRTWLAPFRKTWFADWIKARPEYRRFAKLHRAVWKNTPSWAAEVTR